MGSIAQKRALEHYRKRLAERGLTRFEVVGLKDDRDLLRAIARRLARDDTEAAHLRDEVRKAVGAEKPPVRGGILAAFRRSPLVGADLNLARDSNPDRKLRL